MWPLVTSTSTMPKKYSFYGLSAPNAPSSAHIPSLSPAHAVERERRYSLGPEQNFPPKYRYSRKHLHPHKAIYSVFER